MKILKVIETIALVIAVVCAIGMLAFVARNDDLPLEVREQLYVNEYVEEHYGSKYYGTIVDFGTYLEENRMHFEIYSEKDPSSPVATVSVPRAKYNLENS